MTIQTYELIGLKSAILTLHECTPVILTIYGLIRQNKVQLPTTSYETLAQPHAQQRPPSTVATSQPRRAVFVLSTPFHFTLKIICSRYIARAI